MRHKIKSLSPVSAEELSQQIKDQESKQRRVSVAPRPSSKRFEQVVLNNDDLVKCEDYRIEIYEFGWDHL